MNIVGQGGREGLGRTLIPQGNGESFHSRLNKDSLLHLIFQLVFILILVDFC